MVLSSVKVDGRIIAVGDPAQSIYQFRGADSEAIPNFIDKLRAKTLPLSVTYRCPKSVVRLAQEVVPDIEAAPGAPEGTVRKYSLKNFLNRLNPEISFLSRTNAPLIKYCLKLLRPECPLIFKVEISVPIYSISSRSPRPRPLTPLSIMLMSGDR